MVFITMGLENDDGSIRCRRSEGGVGREWWRESQKGKKKTKINTFLESFKNYVKCYPQVKIKSYCFYLQKYTLMDPIYSISTFIP
jgi:hypothetical protein